MISQATRGVFGGISHGHSDFHTTLQCWNNVVTIRNNVATMLHQCCNAVLR